MVKDVRIYDKKTKKVSCLTTEQIGFGYRTSTLKHDNIIILSATLALTVADACLVKNNIQKFRQMRLKTQPIGQPSLGSVFKRPNENLSAAKLIDDCGLKGKCVGGAMISEKHAGFIVNIGGASTKDYLNLSRITSDKVYEKFGVRLEREIEVL